ncbi:hypothetical protein TrVE_jg8713 [Triparma verrucosa]|uniref:fructose-bisphosphatase n=1 Tax=Triparma verrucosa TaxID=1606542 RepID=A0A9W7EHK1_9STRA|nr:hypothetical protein TrVE_jg8713 [Triparma verrucosa]
MPTPSSRFLRTNLNGFLGLGNNNNNKQEEARLVQEVNLGDPVVMINNVPTVAQGQLSTITLQRYLSSLVSSDESLREMEGLMLSIAMACKTISTLVNRAGINQLTGLETDVMGTRSGSQSGKGKNKAKKNIQGEDQKKLDVLSNGVLKNALKFTGKLGLLASEEEDEALLIESALDSRYVAVFDPLDGSSNIDASICTGTIFGVLEDDTVELKNEYKRNNDDCVRNADAECVSSTEALLQPGSQLAASGYCMYSSSTILVFTLGGSHPVIGFTLDPQLGEFVLTHPNMRVPKRGTYYSVNEGNSWLWDASIRHYIDKIKRGEGETKKRYSSRYVGSMVGDVHRTLLYGGIFGNPGDVKHRNGKLRLVYECSPMSFLVEQAGGGSCTSDGGSVLEVVPESVHQRSTCWLGSIEDVEELRAYLIPEETN